MPVRLPPSPTKTKLARAVRRLMDFIPLASVGRVLALEEALAEAARKVGHEYGKQLAQKIIAIANFSDADAKRGRI